MSVAPGLARHGHVLAPDLPGFGYSPPPKSYRMVSARDTVIGFLSQLGEPALLIGNSLGGLVAEMVAAARPNLVASLLLVAPATPIPPGRPDIDWPVTIRLVAQALPGFGAAYIRRYQDRATAAQQVWDTLGLVTFRRQDVDRMMVEASVRLATLRRSMPWAVPALVQSGRAVGSYLARRSRFAVMIGEIKAPTMVVQGIHDRVVAPGSIRWLGTLRKDWRIEMMEEASHCPQLDAPDRFIDLVDGWLASLDARSPR
jgi:pimeloyl-ACP methyl ester carboxylesterase